MTDRSRRMVFDAVAERYDEVRPGYPEGLVDVVCAGVANDPRLLEVGSGTGKATMPYARRGFGITCVEPGENLAAVAQRNLAAYDVSFDICSFEEWRGPDNTFDVLYSAQAWHWIDPQVGYPKAARHLRRGGRLAIYGNMYPRYRTEFADAVQEVYRAHAPEILAHPHIGVTFEQRIAENVEEIEASGCFEGLKVHRFEWDHHLDRESYIKLMDTYSNHLVIPDERRQKLYEGIARMIDDFGGHVVRPYEAILFLATSP